MPIDIFIADSNSQWVMPSGVENIRIEMIDLTKQVMMRPDIVGQVFERIKIDE